VLCPTLRAQVDDSDVPDGVAVATDGSSYVFSANGGTNDVSVIDLGRALRGDPRAEIGRIPMQVGPWGIAATPDKRHIIVANGGSQRDGSAGNTRSFGRKWARSQSSL